MVPALAEQASTTMKMSTILPVAIASCVFAVSAQAITIFGLGAGGQIYRFDSAAPAATVPVGVLSASGVVDIDFRGSNGSLYGISASGATSTINTITGGVTPLFTPLTSLGGTVSGFDFNPAADRMRIVVGGVNNFRMVPDGISGTPAGTVVVDGAFGVPSGVSLLDVGYTNPGGGSTTTLYSVGSNGILYTHPAVGAPQFNTLAAVGSIGFTPGADIGFNIDSSGTGYLVNGSNFYTVNLATGSATLVGALGQSLTSIAVVPEPSSVLLGAVGGLVLLRRRREA